MSTYTNPMPDTTTAPPTAYYEQPRFCLWCGDPVLADTLCNPCRVAMRQLLDVGDVIAAVYLKRRAKQLTQSITAAPLIILSPPEV